MVLPPRHSNAHHDAGRDASGSSAGRYGPAATALADTFPPAGVVPATLQIEVQDWDLLFEAIQAYLCATIEGRENALTGTFDLKHAPANIREHVLNSVDALEKLHRALHHERSLQPHP
ncbi:hypothetical protein [Polaromonas sp. YR568]|uniref:hypothetical protein n=1 Tax=Polaromonas sp. YR568 TaxID=1855301 RepID=UPI00313835A1